MVNDKKMKTTYAFILMIVMLAGAGCEIDNYEAPQITVSGRIVDSQTGELVESGGINAGSVVKLYQGNSTQPLIYSTLPEGTFTNSKVFAGTYSYLAEGPFVMVENNTVININGDTEMEIRVIPNVRLGISVLSSDATSATIKLSYEKLANQKLMNLGVVWSKYRNPNAYTFSGGAIDEDNVESMNLSAGEMTFTITNLQPNTKYYIRGLSRTANAGNFYNYSTSVELQAQ